MHRLGIRNQKATKHDFADLKPRQKGTEKETEKEAKFLRLSVRTGFDLNPKREWIQAHVAQTMNL